MTAPLHWLNGAALESVLQVDLAEARELVLHRHVHYKPTPIPSRNKTRWLDVPTGKLKQVQQRVVRRILSRVEPHPAAFCHVGKGALHAAKLHVRHPFLLHLDIADFFPSVSERRVRDTLLHYGVDSALAPLLAGLVTHRNRLPQGAPTSVGISNLVLTRLDQRLAGLCRKYGLTYTRYVDDIAISGGARLAWVEPQVRKIVVSEGWRLNSKGGLSRPDEKHLYLGIVVNTCANADSGYRRDLRTALRRIEREATVLDERAAAKLKGKMLYIQSVNPKLGEALLARFGHLVSSLDVQ